MRFIKFKVLFKQLPEVSSREKMSTYIEPKTSVRKGKNNYIGPKTSVRKGKNVYNGPKLQSEKEKISIMIPNCSQKRKTCL